MMAIPMREPSGPASWPLSQRDLAQEGAFGVRLAGPASGVCSTGSTSRRSKCTFFACAVVLERNPAAAREIGEAGPRCWLAHGYRWEDGKP